MKISQNTLIIGGLIIAAIVGYYFYRKNSVSSASASAIGAVDALDESFAQQIISAITNSQFSGDLNYILSDYNNSYAPGKSLQDTSISTTPTKTGGLLKEIWTGWVGSYTSNAQPGNNPPVTGKTQAQATAAATLAQDVNTIAQAYKQQVLLRGI